MRRCLVLILALCLLGTPALADPSTPCGLWERQVYAVTNDGGLVRHTFCLDANRTESRWMNERVVATTGWADVSTVFWSGTRYDRGVFYRVSATDGTLHESADLQSWQQVSPADWRGFTSLISPEPDVVYGTDPSGTVRRWVRWREEKVGVLPEGSRLLGRTEDGFAGIDGTDPGVVSVWPGELGKFRIRITAPSTVDPARAVPFDLGQKYPTSAWTVTTTGRLADVVPVSCAKLGRTWQVDEETGGGYRLVFAGDYTPNGQGPVEWQCVGKP
ncbi:hypothetical protein Lesp02_72190 [Lentzea sp. NBRC 105346]|uniref:hypothetical protein n=1 Tax=Lentzea sp. NBRC 105346 TaxID=3032205 RepID=UPI0024A40132|nr:hypothetical protein [Lentzea sp. NBRC 105346]GLZ35032.1 hypothetical protein Lesp02_72190 [Lentzea sp. NBRC 105346]